MNTSMTRQGIAITTIAITSFGMWAYVRTIQVGGTNVFEWVGAILFGILFGWIAFSFSVATIGVIHLLREKRSNANVKSTRAAAEELNSCAVLVPVYNESPEDVFARVEAMYRDLMRLNATKHFEFYVLSDSTDHEKWLAEQWVWSEMMKRLGSQARVYYRHRSENIGRKAGNIADFCTRWSGNHQFMVILDADSLMSGETLVEMVRRMSADPKLGILQVPPIPIGRQSLFARLQQFSAHAYGAVFVRGFDRWAGDQGNYWGHNAIIRIDAFRDHCDLPVLPGVAPLGGAILSHDFVEAALMVAANWKVRLADDLGGSYEECPTTLADYAQRDLRWCQGNLQHSRLILSSGFRLPSRLHFASGVMSYVSSPLWIAFTIACIAGWLLDGAAENVGVVAAYGQLALFAAAMLMLLVPKIYGLAITAKTQRDEERSKRKLTASVCVEAAMSILISPIMALLHTRFVIATLRGKKIQWNAQQRDEHGVTLMDAFRQGLGFTLAGIAITTMVYLANPALLIWFLPIVTGLLLAIPLIMLLGSQAAGKVLARWGVLSIPEEIKPLQLSRDFATALTANQKAMAGQSGRLFRRVLDDPGFFRIHCRVLKASDADRPLSSEDRLQTQEIAEADLEKIPVSERAKVLSDTELLKQLHVQSQLMAQSA
ncbi:glucans biosynthesis glucosyltransferase MdoH [Stieleria sp. JC731]|uniref:glucans biosynthesis glucosyltransferase MdoH n=1 Tax=Pirellulaceae TaxID=2691357 RepID=UPI001E4503D3|nr:glucans biosynthesis glucosyltransferase MdoH [Stieleria sp. JC731]MCC9603575.1 glucans biosynthesis glucosyltransferase MdoH [Stieleria sp. JC731]